MNQTIIIAEAGVNHNGDIELAKKLIDAAADAKADYVKFQTFKAEKLVTKSADKAAYQKKNAQREEGQFEMLKKLELSEIDHIELIDHCVSKKIKFLSTAFDADSIYLLKKLGITLGKIPSGEITNLPYLRLMAQSFPEIILSTGMADMEEISAALNVIVHEGINKNSITILHCNTEYPTPMSDVNLLAMLDIQKHFATKVGYSDHTLGIEVPVAAVALGASVLEKHFTLDRKMDGPDHAASLEPNELKAMIDSIRNIEKALGTGVKKPSPSEIKNKPIARKSIVAAKKIKKGEIFSEENLTVKRPGNGISPMRWDEVKNKKAIRDFEEDELIVL
ncbi:MAG TPA: N-acetylneuraminate synthase [Chitinophagaceae bacterium]